MKFNLNQFYKFCAQLKIETKEQGLRKMDTLLGTQTYVMDEITKGLQDDCHFFVILKGRQLGITTISLALDLYWHFTHPGLQGTLTTDTEENRDMFRSTLAMYMEGLPKEYRIPLLAHNRNQLSLKNRSRLFYQVAGLRAKGSLGRGKAITYLHGTETSSWGDEEGLASLLASLAETNPDRLYLFESTARGFNMFHDMYVTAKRARTQRAIFCGWWRNELYMLDPNSQTYKVYWDGKLTGEEKEWVRDIKKLYNFEINSRQIAWWRWKLYEGIKDDSLMYQEFPPTEDYAFVMTGTSFFSNARCTDAVKRLSELIVNTLDIALELTSKILKFLNPQKDWLHSKFGNSLLILLIMLLALIPLTVVLIGLIVSAYKCPVATLTVWNRLQSLRHQK